MEHNVDFVDQHVEILTVATQTGNGDVSFNRDHFLDELLRWEMRENLAAYKLFETLHVTQAALAANENIDIFHGACLQKA